MKSEFLEPLEDRRLLSSITLTTGGTLIVVGNQNTANTISVGYSPGTRYVVVVLNGVASDYRRQDVNSLQLFGGNANDYMVVSQARAEFTKSVKMIGGAGNDTMIGGDENDVIFGDSGNDYISLGAGDDYAISGSGYDRILGGPDTKIIYAQGSNGVIKIGAAHGYVFGGTGDVAISDASGSNMEILGGGGNETITSHGDDTIWGGSGNDVIHGGSEVHRSTISGLNKIMGELMPVEPTPPAGST